MVLNLLLSRTPISYRAEVLPIAFIRSLSTRSRAAMFSKAIQNDRPRPLANNPSRINFPPASPPAIAGMKRKIDLVPPTATPPLASAHTPLASLHSEVYFDENDIDDDENLDLGVSIPVPQTIVTQSRSFSSSAMNNLPPPPPVERIKPPPPINDTTAQTDVHINTPFSSSAPLPWSSSPPEHNEPLTSNPTRNPTENSTGSNHTASNLLDRKQEVSTGRTLPWKKEVNNAPPDPTPYTTKERPVSTVYPYGSKTSSTVKEQQKELRRLQKNKALVEKEKNSAGKRAIVPKIFLSEEQRKVLDVIVDKERSVFFTGSAGTGKSVLMRETIRNLRQKYRKEPDRVAVTASTGLAACNIEGVTLHSFAGVGLGKEAVPDLIKKVKRNPKAKMRWLRTKVLVVDEISMVDGDFFDKLEEISRRIRNNGRPFGGIQLVVTGDFFQLPPVPENNREAKFAFSASTWNTSIEHTILLTQVFRQSDPEFAAMLNDMRLGKLSNETIKAFHGLSRPLDVDDSIEATELFPTRSEVEQANAARMNRLSGQLMTFNAVDSGSVKDVERRARLLASCMAPPTVQLKKGAQVMLIKNLDDSLVNGSLGRVVDFMNSTEFDDWSRRELGYGSVDPSPDEPSTKKIKSMAFGGGQVGINTETAAPRYPMVCFVNPDGTERHLLCTPETWKIELPNGEVEAQRMQIPLILAWALSIHKAQGQTLQRVKVDLGRVFERGQAYVALSRAVSKDGLQVTRFDPRKVMVHPKVINFYTNLSSARDLGLGNS